AGPISPGEQIEDALVGRDLAAEWCEVDGSGEPARMRGVVDEPVDVLDLDPHVYGELGTGFLPGSLAVRGIGRFECESAAHRLVERDAWTRLNLHLSHLRFEG